jgi:hypothetical protein
MSMGSPCFRERSYRESIAGFVCVSSFSIVTTTSPNGAVAPCRELQTRLCTANMSVTNFECAKATYLALLALRRRRRAFISSRMRFLTSLFHCVMMTCGYRVSAYSLIALRQAALGCPVERKASGALWYRISGGSASQILKIFLIL